MNEKLEEYLIEKFPHYYDGERLMQFSHGDGWFLILLQLSMALEKADPQHIVKPIQIKEKFGSLNFYYAIDGTPIDLNITAFDHKISAIINEHTKKAGETCELCGSVDDVERGAPEGGYWIRTLCKNCKDDLAKTK